MKSNLETIQTMYAAFGRGDVPLLLEMMDPEIVWENPGPAEIPYFGTHRGRQAVLEQVFGFIGATYDMQIFQPTDFLAAEDKVVVLIHMEALVKRTGKRVVQEVAHAWTMRNGRPVRFHDFQDGAQVARALAG